MSYDPSHGRPRHAGRLSPVMTPEAWPAVEGDAHGDGPARWDGGQDGADPQGSPRWPATGYRSQPGYQDAPPGPPGPPGILGTPRTPDEYRSDYGNGYGYAGPDTGYQGTGYQGTGYQGTGYQGTGNDYPGTGYQGTGTGYQGNGNGYGYAGAGNGYAGTSNGYAGTGNGYAGNGDSFDGGAADGTGGWNGWTAPGSGYGGEPDAFRGADDGGYLDPGGYADPMSSGPVLMAPDIGVDPDAWRAGQDHRRGRGERGLLVGAVTELLAAAVAVGVSTLAAAFVRPQASPALTAGSVFVDRVPVTVKSFAVQHFGGDARTVLLLGMYLVLALVVLEIGVLARRAAALGVAGIAALSLFGAFIVITRTESRVTDLIPAVAGGMAGVAAFLWLQRASAPVTPYGPGGGRRRAR